LENDGFLMKRVATPEQTQVRVKLEHDAKKGSDDEDLFEFPSDKKARMTAGRQTNEEDEDIFAFVDEVKPKPLQEDGTAKSSQLAKKRKLKTSETITELSSVSKRHALEKDVFQSWGAESHKNEPSVSLTGFLNVVQEPKVSVCIMPPKLVIST
jgi:hypothetical protein